MMYRIMVVDDESHVTEWISHLLDDAYSSELDLYRFNDATQALRQLLTGIYDIAVLDISMPEVTGIDILDALESQKIETQVIFLTAYSEFEYAKRAISPQVVTYILKGEPDSVMVEAVGQAIRRIQEKVENDNLVKIAKSRIRASSTNIRREYVVHLLQGAIGSEPTGTAVSLLISPEKPILLLQCALNISGDQSSSPELLLEIGSHIEDYLSRFFVFEGAMLQNNSFVWLLQPQNGDYQTAYSELLAVIENAEMLFNRHTGHDLLFVYSSHPAAFDDIGRTYRQMLPLYRYGYNKGHIVLTDEDLPDVLAEEATSESEYRQLGRDIQILQNLIENGERAESMALLDMLLESFDRRPVSSDPLILEAFCQLSGMVLAILNKTGLYQAASNERSLVWLGNPYSFATWDEAATAFRQMTDYMLNKNARKRDSRSQTCIDKAKDYIIQNLDQDLSLLMLAEKVFLNPSYLSILFKKKVGCNVSDYIKAERLKKAKQLLSETKLKINEIARQVGYPNATYFGKFIKLETGLTPLEYRDRHTQREISL
ncbi:MAG TPA: hypothetical protein DCM45_00215 [Clostridiales bacterium]|nr:hypothetical protein [Clostridiales bacterium]